MTRRSVWSCAGSREINEGWNMCRNIKTLYNLEPQASEEEIRLAALQFVRKISGFARPSAVNEAAFIRAVDEIAASSAQLLRELATAAPPRNREADAARARARAARRFRV
jgi:hypothetical protein